MRAARCQLRLLAAPLVLALAGCDALDRLRPPLPPLPGERVAVLQFERNLQSETERSRARINLARPRAVRAWPQAGGAPSHAVYHAAGRARLKPLFAQRVASGSDFRTRLTAPPLAAGGQVFVLGAQLDLVAVDARTGRKNWTRRLALPGGKLRDGFGGGIAWANGVVYAVTGFGEVIAVRARDGRILWRVGTGVPFRAAPAVQNGRLFVIGHDNRLQVFATRNGERLWEQAALSESATILAAPSVALADEIVIAGFTSGELQSLRASNGLNNWNDSLGARAQTNTPLSEISSIVSGPVIDGDRVFAVSHGGEMVAIDTRTGQRAWDADYASIQLPWVSGNVIFLATLDGQLLCLERASGRLRWVRPLRRAARNGDAVRWSGPVLLGGRLRLVSSDGELLSLSPLNGRILERQNLRREVQLAPIVANGILYILTDNGYLLALG